MVQLTAAEVLSGLVGDLAFQEEYLTPVAKEVVEKLAGLGGACRELGSLVVFEALRMCLARLDGWVVAGLLPCLGPLIEQVGRLIRFDIQGLGYGAK